MKEKNIIIIGTIGVILLLIAAGLFIAKQQGVFAISNTVGKIGGITYKGVKTTETLQEITITNTYTCKDYARMKGITREGYLTTNCDMNGKLLSAPVKVFWGYYNTKNVILCEFGQTTSKKLKDYTYALFSQTVHTYIILENNELYKKNPQCYINIG